MRSPVLRRLLTLSALVLGACGGSNNPSQYTCDVTCPDGSQHNNLSETASSADAACNQALVAAGCPGVTVNYSCTCQNG